MSVSKLDYCQYLLGSPVNCTVTNWADPLDGISHVAIQPPVLRRCRIRHCMIIMVMFGIGLAFLFRMPFPGLFTMRHMLAYAPVNVCMPR